VSRRGLSVFLTLALVLAAFTGFAPGAIAKTTSSNAAAAVAQSRMTKARERREAEVTQAEREAAADRLKAEMAAAETDAVKPTAVPGPGGTPDYFGTTPNWANSPLLKKFIQELPKLSVAYPDTTTYPGSDYYEIELQQYTQKMHPDLPATTLRGYVQVNKGTDGEGNNTIEPDPISYLGPTIFATKDRPVRVKFTNKLPTGEGGDLFIPVDTTIMGAGMGPLGMSAMPMNYTQNRAAVHLHGGKTVWISDGTPHQWITPAGEDTPYPKGVSVRNVPDMPDPGDGSTTFFYSNQQSARMLWYHDHSYGITRLNVYVGEAAGYFITDDTEKKLIADGTIPAEEIPLIIQDKTFVDESTITTTDPTWNWGSTPGTPHTGDLWFTHVYMPNQNPSNIDGVNPMGRWHYGPWFWPPTTAIMNPPVPNPYYISAEATPWENPVAPGVPDNSMGMEAFQDTPIVNGAAYPTLNVDPKAYRFRILNAASDRFLDLQLYEADTSTVSADGRRLTEVKMVPASITPGWPEDWPVDGREGGVPDPTTMGPDWIQIGTESGFLPKPAVFSQQPITWVTDVTLFNAGNVDKHTMLLAPAERSDVVLDFSAYAGKTLILYNDAPAAFPAGDPRYDYYTGAPDLRDTGGVLGAEVGFGPNTRTIMQINVADITPADPYDLDALNAAFASTDTTAGVFEASQNPILVPNTRYDSAYNKTFPADAYVRIFQNEFTFKTIDGTTVTFPLEPKAIQDEMGETFDQYGRMMGNLGLEMPGTNAVNQNFILYGYMDPPTENMKDAMEPLTPVLGDGTQIWKITHNGVDTHPIHFHLFDVQVINRVGWDGFLRYPDDNELGWKDTVRVSPLEDTIVAMRPIVPKQPFGVPESVRPFDPTMPIGSTMGFTNIDPLTGQLMDPPVTNQLFNFGWEYMWHCHILSHEEMDMMRPIAVDVLTTVPAAAALSVEGTPGAPVTLTWVDPTPGDAPATLGDPSNEIGFHIQRATYAANGTLGAYSTIAEGLANQTSYVDTTTVDTATHPAYRYRVVAYNASGSTNSNTVLIGTPFMPPIRISGPDRYTTAIAAAQTAFPDWTNVQHVVVVSGETLVDALAASGLAGAYDGPLLFTQSNVLTAATRNAIAAMPAGVKVHIVGGTPAVSASVASALSSIASVSSVDRTSGSDRYATAAAVATKMKVVLGGAFPNKVFIANGSDANNMYDAIVASPASSNAHLPVLLVSATSVPAATSGAISALGITQKYIVGGTPAVSASIATQLGVAPGDRISGSDRYGTAVAFAQRANTEGWLTYTNVGLTSAIVDGLSGGAMMGKLGGPLLLTSSTSLPTTTRDFLVANKMAIMQSYVFGATNVVSTNVYNAISSALQ